MPGMNAMMELNDEAARRWQAVLERTPDPEGVWVYAVITTGVFCRPDCPSRKPKPANVRFFETATEAAAAGYRACRRCTPAAPTRPGAAKVARAIALLESAEETPTLAALARAVGWSPYHLLRRFRAVTGVTPAAYARGLRRQRFRAALQAGGSITGAIYDAGFSSPSRVYEADQAGLAMTPGRYAKGGRGSVIRYGVFACPLDLLLVAATERGVCAVYLGDDADRLVSSLVTEFPAASLIRDDDAVRPYADQVRSGFDGSIPPDSLPLDVQATAFQARVWQALRLIPRGEVRTYKQIAASLAAPGAYRAVGRACATNPVSVVIPCHRAIRSDGGLAGYRWGLARKRALLAREGARLSDAKSDQQ